VPEKYPVIFYIHGGDFERGASNTFPGHMLAAVGDVVVVTVNYRLGALGTIISYTIVIKCCGTNRLIANVIQDFSAQPTNIHLATTECWT
jgi:acetyl esterase/lipase